MTANKTIGGHLLGLVLIAAVPLLALVGLDIESDFAQSVARSKAELRVQVSVMTRAGEAHLARLERALQQHAREAFGRELAGADCVRALDHLTATHLAAWAVVTDATGQVVCASTAAGEHAGLATDVRVTVGAPRFDAASGRLVSVLSAPLWSEAGALRGGLHLALEPAAFDPGIPAELLPADSRYGYFDHDGVMVWRNLDPEHVIGTRPNADAARRIVEVRDGEFESLAVDGVTRFFSVKPLRNGWVAFVGVPTTTVFADARRRARTSVLLALVALGLMGATAVVVSRRITRPIAALERFARAVHDGALDVKPGERAGEDEPREIAAVTRALVDLVGVKELSEERLRALLEHRSVVAWLKHEDGRLVFASDRFLDECGRTRAEALGRRDHEVWPKDRADQFRAEDLDLLAAGGSREEIISRPSPRGGTSWWLRNKFVFRGSDGQRMVGGLSIDITELRQQEAARRLSDAQLNQAFGASPLGMALCSLDGRLLRVNAALCTFLGRAEAELVGVTLDGFTHADDVLRDAELARELAGGARASYQVERRYLHRDGGERWAQVNASVVRDGGGAPVNVLVQLQDLSERKRAEASARLAVVGTLAAGAAHEINNPLTFVLTNLEWALDELRVVEARTDPARVAEVLAALDEARGGAVRVAHIVAGLKAFARKSPQQREATDVGAVMRSALRLTRTQLQNQAKVVEALAEGAVVSASPRELEQVFINLLVNAAQAIPDGDVRAHCVTVTVRVAAGEVVAEVADTGRGLTPEVRAHLFEPFFTTKPVGVGTGLGLSICHGIVEALVGRIEVESVPGEATVFRVVLPALTTAREAHTPAEEAPLVTLPRRGRVLVVDDEPLVAKALARALRDGPEVVCEGDARVAVRRVAAGEHFDAVVSDVMMPSLSGEEFQRQLAALQPRLAAAMVFVTGGAFTTAASAFLATTKTAWLEKPVDANSLREAVLAAMAATQETDPR